MAGLKDYTPLRLVAGDDEDIRVMSACLQDAVAKVGDFAWLAQRRRFALVANRFVWEAIGDRERGPYIRVRSGLHFDDVLAVRQRNIRKEAKDAVLSLLSIEALPSGDTTRPTVITLTFAGGGVIQLDVEAVSAEMADFSDPWRTRSKPDHTSDDPDTLVKDEQKPRH